MYKTLDELMRNEKNPELYDMRNETGNTLFGAIKDPMEKYLLYKAYPNGMGSKYFPEMDLYIREDVRLLGLENIDCDACNVVKEIYRALWKVAICDKESQISCQISRMYGDTMTSFQTLLNQYVDMFIETTLEKNYRLEKYPSKQETVTTNYCLHLYYSSSDFLQRFNKTPEIREFAAVVHTIGNFLPVPEKFNASRSHNGKHDYWDLTLSKIREWYLADDDNDRESLLGELLSENNEAAKRNCEKWLKWCGQQKDGLEGWKNFVETNYMEAFVEGDERTPIYFCEKHDWDRKLDAKDILQIFGTCSTLIKRRGERMVEKLKNNR